MEEKNYEVKEIYQDAYEKADAEGQSKVLPVLKELFSKTELTFEQHVTDKNEIDIKFTATTISSQSYYSVECKHRNYSHKVFKKGGYLLEDKKKDSLLGAYKKGYKPIYANTFDDGVIIMWDLSKINFDSLKELDKPLPIKTVENKGKKKKDNKLLEYNDAVYKGKYC